MTSSLSRERERYYIGYGGVGQEWVQRSALRFIWPVNYMIYIPGRRRNRYFMVRVYIKKRIRAMLCSSALDRIVVNVVPAIVSLCGRQS